MKQFLDNNFLLHSPTAERLYHEYAANLPIIDYHCHLNPADIALDRQFKNITEAWLYGDHYKWRAMRSNGIAEKYCTGDASDFEKFQKWAETVPFTLRNPLYHWTHLELQRYFNINILLNASSAQQIYQETTDKLTSPNYSARGLMNLMRVEICCTTDDPIDDLYSHKAIKQSGFNVKVLPTWRPDKAMNCDNPAVYNEYIDKLALSASCKINSLEELFFALNKRHEFFHQNGCRLSDHGLETFYYVDSMSTEAAANCFNTVRKGGTLSKQEVYLLKAVILDYLARLNAKRSWTQQFHYGAMRNNNSRMFAKLGPDTGFDSIADAQTAYEMSRFFDRLDLNGELAKTIIYNLNPKDNEMVATMLGNFQDGEIPGKIQFGSGWWFLDQKDGMEKQLNALSSLGLLSRFIGMLTDSRSLLSYPRHEYFRRILCNAIGRDVENGELPNDINLLGDTVRNICYHNAKNYLCL